MANIIFLDQPVGVGFSYKRTPTLDKTGDTIEVVRIHEFIQKVKYKLNYLLNHVIVQTLIKILNSC